MAAKKSPFLELGELSRAAGISDRLLRDVIFRRIDPYYEFLMPKARKGSKRIIAAPIHDLAQAQRVILTKLSAGAQYHHPSFAYRRGVSIKDCAAVHVGARWLVKLDLVNFFHSIDENQVAKIFKSRGCEEALARQLARICTRSSMNAPREQNGPIGGAPELRFRDVTTLIGHLPQGAPTSGLLANLSAAGLDRSMVELARLYQLTYTRYSDDLTFSSQGKFSRQEVLAFIRRARSQIAASQFTMHEGKIRIYAPGSQLQVLGLLVDSDTVRLRGEFKKTLKWHVYGTSRFGLKKYSVSKGFPSVHAYLSHVDGLFAHGLDIEPEWAGSLQKSWIALPEVRAGREAAGDSLKAVSEV